MNTRERTIVYGALVVLLGMNIAAMCGRGAVAVAGDAPPAGPAVDELALAGPDQPLVLRNYDKRLGWNDAPYARAFSIGFVHVGRAVGPLLEADQYRDEYERLQEELEALDKEVVDRIEAFRNEHRDVRPDDPQAGQIQRQFQELLQQREEVRQEANRRMGQLGADQIERAYRDLVAAVEVVAERRDIDIVFRFIPTDLPLEAPAPLQAYTGIRGRLVVKYPPQLDITDEVLEELAVP